MALARRSSRVPKLSLERGKVALDVRCHACRAKLYTGVEAASFAIQQIFAAVRNHVPQCRAIERR